jgi:CheY-like chemotaxis protein
MTNADSAGRSANVARKLLIIAPPRAPAPRSRVRRLLFCRRAVIPRAMSNGIGAQVALLDWVLPGMSGIELLGALRQRGIELPVVFFTGYVMVEREL